jgi:heme-degrading monooxygenase HmoA
MNLILKREYFGDTFTVGKLYKDDQYIGYTLEDKVREVKGMPISTWKEFGNTAIPEGTYKVSVTFSNRFKLKLPQLLDVPGFTGVRIHTGNSSKDTEGCILIGSVWDGKSDWLGGSKTAFSPLLHMIEESKDQVTINIS